MNQKTPKTTRRGLVAPVAAALAGCALLLGALAAGGADSIHWADAWARYDASIVSAVLGAGVLAVTLVLALGSRPR